MAPTYPEERLIGYRLYIIKRVADLSSYTILLGYDVEQSALLAKPIYCYVRMVHRGHDWAVNFSEGDKNRPVLYHRDRAFVILGRAQVKGEGPLAYLPEDRIIF